MMRRFASKAEVETFLDWLERAGLRVRLVEWIAFGPGEWRVHYARPAAESQRRCAAAVPDAGVQLQEAGQ